MKIYMQHNCLPSSLSLLIDESPGCASTSVYRIDNIRKLPTTSRVIVQLDMMISLENVCSKPTGKSIVIK